MAGSHVLFLGEIMSPYVISEKKSQ